MNIYLFVGLVLFNFFIVEPYNFCIKATATYTREEIFDLLNILQNGSGIND